MFIVSIHYKADLSEIDQCVAEHIRFLDDCYEQGYFLASGPKVPRTGGVILARAANRAELENILSLDPFSQKNLADYEVTEFTPTKSILNFEK